MLVCACDKFGDYGFSRFGSIVRRDRQTHRRGWTHYFRDSRAGVCKDVWSIVWSDCMHLSTLFAWRDQSVISRSADKLPRFSQRVTDLKTLICFGLATFKYFFMNACVCDLLLIPPPDSHAPIKNWLAALGLRSSVTLKKAQRKWSRWEARRQTKKGRPAAHRGSQRCLWNGAIISGHSIRAKPLVNAF